MGIQSIPAVVAFVAGRPKDAFMGARPESEIKRFIEKLAPGRSIRDRPGAGRRGAACAGGQPAEAANLYAAVLQHEPQNITAIAGLGGLYLEMGRLEQGSRQCWPPCRRKRPAIRHRLAARRDRACEQAASLGDPAALQKRIEANPKDFEARFDLALIYNALASARSAPTSCSPSSSAIANGAMMARAHSC